MWRWGLTFLLAALPLAALADNARVTAPPAPPSVSLGWGRLFNNDAIGDLQDRWHTGSYTISQVRGPYWRGVLPDQPFQLLEFRFTSDTVAPENLASPSPNDRRFAGILGFGAHTQFEWKGLQTNIGGDIYLTGPQTGLSNFQDWVHDVANLPDGNPSYGNQIGDGFYPTASAEIGKSYALGHDTRFRPFASAMAGLETLTRVGGDLTIGHFGEGAVMLRDMTTGQRYRAVAGDLVTGYSFTLGGDVAHVFSSALLPTGGNVDASQTRTRLRMGVHWQGRQSAVFYGLTWLGPEYVGQPTGQVVGSLHIQLQF